MKQHVKQTLSIQLPSALASEVEELAIELDRSTSWVVEEALRAIVKTTERHHQQILQGLADVDGGRVMNHADMVDFANRLKNA
ncbi:CopG family transcriptional regulator [Yersinia rohdei]|uniref:CopG family transcriptional regulator n=1 Tax=Yersinia rohdei TaxID=29485 RepID=A0A0U1HRC9_YERRO|nr:ribbon-helix-helix protein, CopG family [Yersinia rohdei]CQI89152.1 CopG family transcriptional regulator [Yersinia rohdei]